MAEELDELRDELAVLKQQGLFIEGRASQPPSPRALERFDVPDDVKNVRRRHAHAKRRYNKLRESVGDGARDERSHSDE